MLVSDEVGNAWILIKYLSAIALQSDKIGNRPSSNIVAKLKALMWTRRKCVQALIGQFSNLLNILLLTWVSVILFVSEFIFFIA